ncbi:MAG: DUF4832 domain-containing protein [Velocimicrobium sp.]
MNREKAKKIKSNLLFIVFPICLIFIGLTLIWMFKNYRQVNFSQADLTETTNTLSNPYAGWYHIYGYLLSDDETYNKTSVLTSCEKDTDTNLALLEINLKNYNMGSISDFALTQLDTILSAWTLTDKQLIVRFVYDWDGHAIETEPDEISTVLKHISQVSSIVNHYSTTIYILQGIFVGDYGEMHDSNYMSKESMLTLIHHLADVIDSSIYLSVRTPAQLRQITSSFSPLDQADAFSDTLPARLSLFNDGMLGSETDCGTYGTTNRSDALSFSNQWTRADELSFQSQLCNYVPNGGEVILDNSYNDLDTAISDFFNMHVSYLNNQYDPGVLNKWKSTLYQGSDIFNGCSGYAYVANHLGYRYVLRKTNLTSHKFGMEPDSLSISLENVGFANCYQNFSVSLVIKNIHTNEVINLPIKTDTRDWLSNTITSIDVPLNTHSYELGDYWLYLLVVDRPFNKPIQFANTTYDTSLGYLLGSFSIKKFS